MAEFTALIKAVLEMVTKAVLEMVAEVTASTSSLRTRD